jgi:hypothetical protein
MARRPTPLRLLQKMGDHGPGRSWSDQMAGEKTAVPNRTSRRETEIEILNLQRA